MKPAKTAIMAHFIPAIVFGVTLPAMISTSSIAQTVDAAKMAGSLSRALFLLEMDTAAWAATDQAHPILEEKAKKISKKTDFAGYIQWKEGTTWHVLFFYELDGQFLEMVEILLAPPLTRQSRGTMESHPWKKGPPLEGTPLALARAFGKAKKHLEQKFSISAKPYFNHYLFLNPDGTILAAFLPSDMATERTMAGPDLEMTLSADGTSILQERQFHHRVSYLELRSPPQDRPSTQTLFLETAFPEYPDFFRLLLHPELGPLTVSSPEGRFRMRAGAVPTRLRWMVPATPAASDSPSENVVNSGGVPRSP